MIWILVLCSSGSFARTCGRVGIVRSSWLMWGSNTTKHPLALFWVAQIAPHARNIESTFVSGSRGAGLASTRHSVCTIQLIMHLTKGLTFGNCSIHPGFQLRLPRRRSVSIWIDPVRRQNSLSKEPSAVTLQFARWFINCIDPLLVKNPDSFLHGLLNFENWLNTHDFRKDTHNDKCLIVTDANNDDRRPLWIIIALVDTSKSNRLFDHFFLRNLLQNEIHLRVTYQLVLINPHGSDNLVAQTLRPCRSGSHRKLASIDMRLKDG